MTDDMNKHEQGLVNQALEQALHLPETPGADADHARAQHRARDHAEAALKRANAAARRGDSAEAKRWSEIARNMAEAARTLAEAPPPMDDPEEEERLRAELRARLGAHVQAEQDLARWEMRKQIWDEMAAMAQARGLPAPPPMPPRPPHWSDSLPDDLRQRVRPER